MKQLLLLPLFILVTFFISADLLYAANEYTMITQNESQEINNQTILCEYEYENNVHTDNSYYRVYDLTDFSITQDWILYFVDIGVRDAEGADGSQPLEIKLHTATSVDLPSATLTQFYEEQFIIQDTVSEIVQLELDTPQTLDPEEILVIEVFIPDGIDDMNSLILGANDQGQNSPSYIKAEDCGINEITDIADQGFPHRHNIINGRGAYIHFDVDFDVTGLNGTLEAIVNGNTIAPGDSIEEGKDIEFIASPDEGYIIKEWTLNGAVVDNLYDFVYVVKNLSEDIDVTVEFEEKPEGFYPVYFSTVDKNGEISASEDGTAISSGELIEEGKDIHFTAVPYDHYEVKQWTVNGVVMEDEGTIISDEEFTYENLVEDITVNVEFEPVEYTVNFSVVEVEGVRDGTLAAYADDELIVPGNKVQEGKDILFIASPDDNCRVKQWTINGSVFEEGEDIFSGEELVYDSLAQDITITVEFEPAMYNVDFNVVEVEGFMNGTLTALIDDEEIEPGDVIQQGEQIVFNANPDDHYRVKQWTRNGDVIGSFTGKQLTHDLIEDLTVTVEFEPVLYSVNYSVVEVEGHTNGVLIASVDGEEIDTGDEIQQGENVVFSAQPDIAYRVKDWIVDGIPLDLTDDNYTIDSLAGNVNIEVEFEVILHEVMFSVEAGEGDIYAIVNTGTIDSGEEVKESSEITFKAYPDLGNKVKDWTLNGISVNPGETDNEFVYGFLDSDINVTVEFEQVTSLFEASANDSELFPNPFDNEIFITNTENVKRITITDITGVIVMQKHIDNDSSVNTGHLSDGIYFVTLKPINGDKVVYKMIKK